LRGGDFDVLFAESKIPRLPLTGPWALACLHLSGKRRGEKCYIIFSVEERHINHTSILYSALVKAY
jgi:hypothetical protein